MKPKDFVTKNSYEQKSEDVGQILSQEYKKLCENKLNTEIKKINSNNLKVKNN